MRTLLKTLCVTLALALAALSLPAGVFALEQDVAVDETNFPDQIFRGWLLNKDNLNGAGSDGVLTSAELAQITALDLSDLGIRDLTGIERFTALERLDVKNNQLTELDLRQNTRLRSLHCATNALERLDVTACPELVDLNCERNRLTSLDLSGNPKLVQLYCRHNSLTQLDVSHNLELVFIETFDNSLTSFDCSMLKKLEFLHIDYNQLTTLNMRDNPALKGNGFVAANNHLKTLDLPNIPGFTVEAEVFYEQNPQTGHDTIEWYLDPGFTQPVSPTDTLPANGQTLYARWVPNPYTVYYRPNGGQGSMEPQSAAYGVSFALTPNAFTRTGYTFDHWSTYSDGVGGRVFQNGATVENLAGENSSRDAVYLYAQWRPNEYIIRFAPGAAEGSMDDLTAQYDASASLPDCAFSLQGQSFLGWSTKEGDARPEFFAGQAVRNLTAEAGGVVTLYPVWISHDEIQSGYRQALLALVGSYDENDYYGSDWAKITAAQEAAGQAITAAGDDQNAMQSALNDAAEAMSAVPDRAARAEEITQGWASQFATLLGQLNAPVRMEDCGDRQADVRNALTNAQQEKLVNYSTLSSPDNAEAARQALLLLEGELARLQAMDRALNWMGQANRWYDTPMGEVTSSAVADLARLEQNLNVLDADARFFCDPAAVAAVSERARLAGEKADALKALDAEYARLTQWEYTEANKQLLDTAAAALRKEIEAAEAAGMPGALLVAGKAQLEQVDPIPKVPAVTTWPTAAPLIKGQALKTSALTGGKADVPGAFAWKEPDAKPETGGSFTVVFTPEDTRRYETVEQQVELTVRERPATPAPGGSTSTGPSPAVTPVPAPSATPAPATAKPTPSPTAVPTATPLPSASPSPSPSPASSPSPSPESAPADGPVSGDGASPGVGFALPLLAVVGAAALAAAVLVVRARRRS